MTTSAGHPRPGEERALPGDHHRALYQSARAPVALRPSAERALTDQDGGGWLLTVGDLGHQLGGRRATLAQVTFVSLTLAVALSLVPLPALKSILVVFFMVAAGIFDSRGWRRSRRLLGWVQGLPGVISTAALAELPQGAPARVVGVIAPGATLPSLFRGLPCVLSRNAFLSADELRGVDFALVLEDGQRVPVAVRGAHLVNRPEVLRSPPVCGPVAAQVSAFDDRLPRLMSALYQEPPSRQRRGRPREVSVGPGDRVEVTGLVQHEVAPDGVATPGRQPPMRHALVSGPGTPLLVRRL